MRVEEGATDMSCVQKALLPQDRERDTGLVNSSMRGPPGQTQWRLKGPTGNAKSKENSTLNIDLFPIETSYKL